MKWNETRLSQPDLLHTALYFFSCPRAKRIHRVRINHREEISNDPKKVRFHLLSSLEQSALQCNFRSQKKECSQFSQIVFQPEDWSGTRDEEMAKKKCQIRLHCLLFYSTHFPLDIICFPLAESNIGEKLSFPDEIKTQHSHQSSASFQRRNWRNEIFLSSPDKNCGKLRSVLSG